MPSCRKGPPTTRPAPRPNPHARSPVARHGRAAASLSRRALYASSMARTCCTASACHFESYDDIVARTDLRDVSVDLCVYCCASHSVAPPGIRKGAARTARRLNSSPIRAAHTQSESCRGSRKRHLARFQGTMRAWCYIRPQSWQRQAGAHGREHTLELLPPRRRGQLEQRGRAQLYDHQVGLAASLEQSRKRHTRAENACTHARTHARMHACRSATHRSSSGSVPTRAPRSPRSHTQTDTSAHALIRPSSQGTYGPQRQRRRRGPLRLPFTAAAPSDRILTKDRL